MHTKYDTEVGREINTEKDSLSLQDDLNRVLKWLKDWQMQFNADKCKVLRLGNNDKVTRYELDGAKNIRIKATAEGLLAHTRQLLFYK